jgi:hypothetical protein
MDVLEDIEACAHAAKHLMLLLSQRRFLFWFARFDKEPNRESIRLNYMLVYSSSSKHRSAPGSCRQLFNRLGVDNAFRLPIFD